MMGKLIAGPPAHYNHAAALKAPSQRIVRRHFPELLPLVDQGTLLVLERPDDYRERRSDYQEPLQIFLVGTAHVSAQSADDVRRVVRAVQPDAVVVELCRSRQALMQAQPPESQRQQPGPNLLGLSGGPLLPAFMRSVELGGTAAVLLRVLLARLSTQLSGKLGVQGGMEFVAARQEAEAIGAQLVLGDRPIEITLQRAWSALSWRQRARLALELAGGLRAVQQMQLDAATVERLKDDDAVSMLFDQLSRAYPELVGPLVHERDLYLSWSLKRSKAVNGVRRVVGVVGKGHQRGVCYALTHDAAGAHLRFRDLVGSSASRRQQRAAAAGRFALETALFGALALGCAAFLH